MTTTTTTSAFALALALAAEAAIAAPGDLETSFGGDGRATLQLAGAQYGEAVASLSKGYVIVAGRAFNGTDYDIFVARFAPDGNMDNGFGQDYDGDGFRDGYVLTDVSGNDGAYDVIVDASDDATIVAGYAGNNFAVVRYDVWGDLDPLFGGGGIATVDFAGGTDVARALVMDSAGRLIVVGSTWNGAGSDLALARLTTTGLRDTSFGTLGRVTTNVAPSDGLYDVALGRRDEIYVAGVAGTHALVASYDATGALRSNFGTAGTGIVTLTPGLLYTAEARSLALDSSYNIVVAGTARNTAVGSADFALFRLDPMGLLDTSFGAGGFTRTAFITGANETALTVIVLGTSIYACGKYETAMARGFALARYTSTGALDAAFGAGGRVTTAIAGSLPGQVGCAAMTSYGLAIAGTSYAPAGYVYDVGVNMYEP